MANQIPLHYTKVGSTATGFREYATGDKIAAAYLDAQPPTLTGTYSARPTASSVPVNSIYFATDVQEMYISNGSSWTTLPASGSVLGAANLGTAFSTTSTSSVDVTGMVVTFTAGTRPVLVSWGGACSMLGGTTTDLFAVTLYQGPSVSSQILMYRHPQIITVHREQLVTGLTPGAAITFSLKANVGTSGTTLQIGGAPTDSFYLRVQSA